MNVRFRVALLAACAAVYASAGSAADDVRVVNEGGIRDEWMLAEGVSLAAPGYPSVFAERGDNVCIAMGYLIKPDGTTSDFSLLKSWTSSSQEKEPATGFWDAFSQAGAHALSQWKFKARPEIAKPRPTYTVATMTFIGKEATDAAGLRSKCNVGDMQAFVQGQKAKKFWGGKDKQELENMQRSLQQAQQAANAASMMQGNAR